MSGPQVASSSAALSRTERVIAWPTLAPFHPSPRSGPMGLRARVGFRPNSPQHEAGIRIEPPPSVACAMGSMPAATAAAAPPLEPPALISQFQGFLVGPNSRGSVEVESPNSGVLVLPKMTRPARFMRATISLSWSATALRKNSEPADVTAPAQYAPRSLRR